jgi:hypothetical protein
MTEGKVTQKCMYEGCDKTEYLTVLYNPWVDDDDEGSENGDTYCSEHVPDCYCAGCGHFSAGIESFDFSPIKGLCSECVDELRDELGEDRDGNPIEYDDDEGWDEGDY